MVDHQHTALLLSQSDELARLRAGSSERFLNEDMFTFLESRFRQGKVCGNRSCNDNRIDEVGIDEFLSRSRGFDRRVQVTNGIESVRSLIRERCEFAIAGFCEISNKVGAPVPTTNQAYV